MHEFAQLLISRTGAISIYKVRAHTGVAGNTAVDKLAGLEHDLPIDPDTTFRAAGTTGREAHWIQYATDSSGSPVFARPAPAYRDVDTLKQHVSMVARAQHAHKLMTPKKVNSVMSKNAALL